MNTDKLLNEFEQKLIVRSFSSNSISNYKSNVNCFLKFLEMKHTIPEAISKEIVLEFLFRKNEKRCIGNSHQRMIVSSIEKFYNLVYDRTLDLDYLEFVRDPFQLPDCLSMEDVKRMIDKIENIKHRCIVKTLYGTGMRLSELQNLTLRDFDFKNMLISIRNNKDEKSRIVMIPDTLLSDLKNYIRQYRPQKYFFEGKPGNFYSQKGLQMIVRNAALNARIQKRVTPYTLRHSFAKHLLESGIDIRYIQQLMGHQHIKSTEIYTYISDISNMKIRSPLDYL